jgi:hypothetical protein
MESSTRWDYATLSGFKSAFRSKSYNHDTPSGFGFGQFCIIMTPLRGLKKQQTIVQKLDALSAQTKKLEAIYQQHLNDLDELKKIYPAKSV